MKWLWIGAAGVLAVAGISAWWAFQNPTFMVGFIAASVAAIYKALSPALFKRKSPEDEKKWRDAGKQGREWDHIRNRPKDPR